MRYSDFAQWILVVTVSVGWGILELLLQKVYIHLL